MNILGCNRLKHRVAIGIFFAFIVGGILPARAALVPLQVSDLVSMVRFSVDSVGISLAISPDGTQVVYMTTTPFPSDEPNQKNFITNFDARYGRRQLWLQNADGDPATRIGTPTEDAWAPAWSPDGKKIAFYTGSGAHASLAIWDTTTHNGRVMGTIVSPDIPVVAPAAQWLPDSTRVLVPIPFVINDDAAIQTTTEPAVMTAPPILVLTSSSRQRIDHSDVVNRQPFTTLENVNLALVQIVTGTSVIVAREVQPLRYRISPDGTRLFYTIDRGSVSSDKNSREIFDIHVVDLRSGSSILAARDILTSIYSDSVTWSPDGSALAFIGGNLEHDSRASLAGSCYIVRLDHPGVLRRVGKRQLSRGPFLWSTDGLTIYAMNWNETGIVKIALLTGETTTLVQLKSGTFQQLSPDIFQRLSSEFRGHVYAIGKAGEGKTEVFDINLTSGNSKTVFQAFQEIRALTFSRDGTRAAYLGEDTSHPEDVWVADSHFARAHQLTALNPDIAGRTLGSAASVSWRTRSGATFDGTLLLPGDYQTGQRYPMILNVYAGDNAGTWERDTFDEGTLYYNLQLYASRGYAIFTPNSTIRVGSPMRDIADVILPGVDKIVAMGIADPHRLGVMGQSYGGYSTLSLIVQTTRFKAAVATSGTSDLITDYGFLSPDGRDNTAWAEGLQGRMGGTPWQYRDRYIENSPFFYLDRVQTPLLLEYGNDDTIVPAYDSRLTFVALRRLGKPATLVGYADEFHIIAKLSNQIDFTNRMLDWFAKYLR